MTLSKLLPHMRLPVAPSTQSATSCATSWPQQLQPKFATCLSMTKKKGGRHLHHSCQKLDHLQPPTPIKTDNSTALGIANNSLKKCKSHLMDLVSIRSTIMSNRINSLSNGDLELKTLATTYFTKHHLASHHSLIRGSFLVLAPASSKYAHSHSPSVL
jgi:hypothetical protein